MIGVVDSWRDSCPLAGQCSECGLIFTWSDLLNPTLSVPPWSFEHTSRRYAHGWLATGLRTATRDRFWSSIRIEHPIRRRRLWVFAFLIILLAHGVCSLAMTSYMIHFLFSSTNTLSTTQIAMQVALTALFPHTVWGWDEIFLAGSNAWFLVIASFLMPLPFLVLSDTFNLARVRFVHLLRIWAYSQPVIWAITLISLLTDMSAWWSPPGPDLRFVPPALQIAGTIWLIDYWGRACKLYLRLPQVTLVLLAMATITILAAIAWMAYIQPLIVHIAEDWSSTLRFAY